MHFITEKKANLAQLWYAGPGIHSRTIVVLNCTTVDARGL